MTQTTQLRALLQPELEAEFAKTRKLLQNIPEGSTAFKPHEKSMSLARLAGHTAEMPDFITLILTSPDVDLATAGFTPLILTTVPQLLAAYDERADKALTAFKNSTDQTFEQNWKLSYKADTIFNGTRYAAYREMGVDHMIHHRGQLGVYLRMLDAPVPGTYGPSADERFGA